MEIQKITNNLNQHKFKIIEVLTVNDWRHFRSYFLIKDKFTKNDFDEQFKNIFCSFYILNGVRGLNTLQKKKFFKLFSLKENDLEKILKVLYGIPGYGNSHKLFLSFGTKLLHTINNKLPIYDKNIAHVLDLSPQTYPASPEERVENRMEIYEELKNNFAVLLANEEIKNYLKSTRQELESKAKIDKFNWHNKFISDTKLLDSLLWALYSTLKNY